MRKSIFDDIPPWLLSSWLSVDYHEQFADTLSEDECDAKSGIIADEVLQKGVCDTQDFKTVACNEECHLSRHFPLLFNSETWLVLTHSR